MNIHESIVDLIGPVPQHLVFIYDIAFIFALIGILIFILSPLIIFGLFKRGR